MTPHTEVDIQPTDTVIEIQGLYDGWSVLKREDGELINRWDKDDRRYAATQEWIDKFNPKH